MAKQNATATATKSKASKAKASGNNKESKSKQDAPLQKYPTRTDKPSELPNSRQLLRMSFGLLRRHWKLFVGILLVYAVLNILFVQSVLNMNVTSVKSSLDQLFQGKSAKLSAAATLFTYMLGTGGSPSSDGGAYQFVLLLVLSLATIYALREVHEGHRLRIRDAFYGGMYPLVPFVLVLATIAVELIPMTIGATLYSAVMTNGIAVHNVEIIFWTLFFAGTCFASLHLVVPTIMSLYISMQPDMTPMRALRTGRRVTRKRRIRVLMRLLFLPIVLFVAAGIILVPAILAVPALASTLSFVLLLIGIAIAHSYLLALCRSLTA
jgi:hypothetical protein